LTRKPLTEVYQSGRKRLEGWRAIKIGLAPERKALGQRVNARTETMLARGWIQEVRGLIESGLSEDAKPFDFIGYRELRLVLENKLTLEAARMAIQQSTRQYAKRQMTWFRREARVCWLEGFGDDPAIVTGFAFFHGLGQWHRGFWLRFGARGWGLGLLLRPIAPRGTTTSLRRSLLRSRLPGRRNRMVRTSRGC
jgi:tRNA dimethylallyltransferase